MPGLFDRTPEPKHARLRPKDRRVHDVLEYDNGRWTGCGAQVTNAAVYVPEGVTCEGCLQAAEERKHPSAVPMEKARRAVGRLL